MENIKSNLTFNTNTNPSGLDQQAASQTSNPFGPNPFAAASPKVLQVNLANSPIPVSIENLLRSNPKERVRTILRMPASPQQDKYFWKLAQNTYLDDKSPYLDGKSRLAAAMKLKDTKKRNTILAALAKDQSLKGAIRLKAVDKIGSFRQRKEMFAALAQDQTLEEADRMEAELSIAFRIESENELHSMETSLDHKHFNAEPNAKPGVAVEAKLEPEEKVEAVQVEELVVVLAPEQPVENEDAPPIQIDPADLERKERALLTIVQDKDVDKHISQGSSQKSYRLEAALKLAPSQRREEALAFLAQDKDWGKVYNTHSRTYTCSYPDRCANLRLEAALALAPGQQREDILALLARDEGLSYFYSITKNRDIGKNNVNFHKNVRLEAALALVPGEKRENILALLAQDKNLDSHWSSVDGKNNDNSPFGTVRQSIIKSIAKNPRLEAALALAPGQRREDILALLAQDKGCIVRNYSTYKNNVIVYKNVGLQAALSMMPGQRKEEILALLAQDKSLTGEYRLEAANSMAGGQAEEENKQ